MPIATRIIGESVLIPPIGIHHVDFKVPISIGRKNNPLTVGRPGGIPVATASIGESLLILPIGVYHVDFKASHLYQTQRQSVHRRETRRDASRYGD